MADKGDKPNKKAKPKKDEKGVLAALPSTRPEPIGTRRAAARTPASAGRGDERSEAAPAPKTTTATAASKAAARPAATKTTAARKRSSATRPKAAAPHTFEPTPAAESAAGERSGPRPRPVSDGAPGIGSAATARTPASAGRGDKRSEAGSPESGRPSGAELAATAVKAAGEVAQLGLTISGQVLKRVVDRLPKP